MLDGVWWVDFQSFRERFFLNIWTLTGAFHGMERNGGCWDDHFIDHSESFPICFAPVRSLRVMKRPSKVASSCLFFNLYARLLPFFIAGQSTHQYPPSLETKSYPNRERLDFPEEAVNIYVNAGLKEKQSPSSRETPEVPTRSPSSGLPLRFRRWKPWHFWSWSARYGACCSGRSRRLGWPVKLLPCLHRIHQAQIGSTWMAETIWFFLDITDITSGYINIMRVVVLYPYLGCLVFDGSYASG